ISFATVTPSLVTLGAPHDFSSTTLRPRGPSVTVTASARMLTPRSTLARASALNSTNFAAMTLSPSGARYAPRVPCARGAVACRGSVSRSLGCVWGFSRPSPDQRPRPPVTGVGEPLAAHVGDRGTAGVRVDLIDRYLKTAACLSFGTPHVPDGVPRKGH